MIIDRIISPSAQPPFYLQDIADHCRADSLEFMEEHDRFGHAASVEIERLCQIALINQTIRVTLPDGWKSGRSLRLPIGPARSSPAATMTVDGEAFEAFDLFTGERPLLQLREDPSAAIISGVVVIEYTAGWQLDKGDELEAALLSGLGKRGGRALIISTSAADDAHPFSRWIDDPLPGSYVQEHRPAPGLPADDRESLLLANPGSEHGIGATLEWLEAQAQRAIARGGNSLTSFRLYNRNERVSGEARDLLITLDEWMACEVDDLPPRQGPCVVGIDLGGSASMSAAAFYWPETGRLECLGTFPSSPTLLDRGQSDGVAGRYVEMQNRGELSVLGDKTVPVAPWLLAVFAQIQGETVAAVVMDRYKQAELGEGLQRAGVRAPLVWRGQGFRDGNEDCERFRRAAFDGQVKASVSLLLRSAFADAVTLRDPANNMKLAKARSTGRIDAAAATVLAVSEGARILARPKQKARLLWA